MTATPEPVQATPVRQRRTWDLILTIVLLLLFLVGAAILSALGFFVAFASDSCGASSVCDYDAIGNATIFAIAGPWIPVLPVLIVSIVLLIKKRIAFWVPIVGGLLSVAALIIGFAWATSAVVRIAS